MESAQFDSTKVDILGSRISIWDLDETVTRLRELAEGGARHYICVSNVHTVMIGYNDTAFADVTNSATLATADGVPLIWASKVLTGPKVHGRASGPDILKLILQRNDCLHLKHFFYGSTPQVLESLENNLSQLSPVAPLAGFYSPPLRKLKAPHEPLDQEELEDCRIINNADPHIVWVGLGAPKQEVWMYRARKHLNAPVLIGVGAAFDFLSRNKSRAPQWMQSSGLEWLHRLMQEPNRLTSRYLKTNPAFVAAVLKQAALTRLKK